MGYSLVLKNVQLIVVDHQSLRMLLVLSIVGA